MIIQKTQTAIPICLLLFLTMLFNSCDPMKLIYVTNDTDSPIEVVIKIKDCDQSFIRYLNEDDSFKMITLGTSNDDKTASFFLGIGKWSKQEIESLNDCTESITVKQVGEPDRVIKGEELQRYLPQKTRAMSKQLLKIKIREE